MANAFDSELVNRVYGNFNASYQINDQLGISYVYGLDASSQFAEHAQNKGGVDGNAYFFSCTGSY